MFSNIFLYHNCRDQDYIATQKFVFIPFIIQFFPDEN